MKTVLPIVIILGVIGAAVLVYSSSQKPSPDSSTPNSTPQQTGGSMAGEDKAAPDVTRYIEYSKANLESAKSSRRILFFYANWCPTCRPADASFSQNENKIPSDVSLIRVNYNDTETDQEEKALAAKYGVTYQHTFVQIDGNGSLVTLWNGGQMNELLQNIK